MGKYGIGKRVRDDEGDEGVIINKRKGERLVEYDDVAYGAIWRKKIYLTPVGADAPSITVEAGKYYKAINGDTIGPMRHQGDGNDYWPFRADGGPFGELYYKEDGKCNTGASGPDSPNYNLVEEWIEETPTQKPKFKVGDKVRIARNSRKDCTWLEDEIGKTVELSSRQPTEEGWGVKGSVFFGGRIAILIR